MGLACAGRKCAHFFGIFRAFSGGPQDPPKWPKMTPQTPPNCPQNPPFLGGFRGAFWGVTGGWVLGGPQDPPGPTKYGHFRAKHPGGAGRPPGEDGGGERGATMPTTSGVESERPWSDLSTRESKAVIESILSRVPTPPRTPT